MRHYWSISDSPDLPIRAFRKALGKNRPATLEGGKGGAPEAPDPYMTADAQTMMNQNSAAYNKALNLNNFTNPFGSQSSIISGYDPKSGAPIYQTNISANPQLQGLLNQQLGNIGQSQFGTNQAIANLGGLQNGYGQLGSVYGEIGKGTTSLTNQIAGLNAADAMGTGQDAYYKAATGYLDPQFAQQQESMEAKLAAQGLAPGSQAYNNAMGNFQRDKAFAYNQAQNSAIMQGQQLGLNQLQAQQGIYGQLAGMGNQQANLLQQQANMLQQQAGLYGQQIGANQLGYQNLGQIASLIPGYSGPAQSGSNAADITGAINNQYQGQLGAYNAKQQSSNANTAALAGLAGTAALMFF